MYSQMFDLHAELLKAIAHPRRLEIIQLLRDKELPVTDIHTMLDLPQANISQHLMVLRDSGIVSTRREGKQIYYKVSHHNILKTSDLIREMLIERHAKDPLAHELRRTMDELVPVVTDPVCGMRVSPKTAGCHTRLNEQNYYFCASGCLKAFTKQPKKYI